MVAKAIEMSSPLLEQRRTRLTVDVPRQRLAGARRRDAAQSGHLQPADQRGEVHAGRGHITVRAAERDGDEVVLRVRDTGIGIAPDVLPHVFDLFVQGRQALDRSQGGLGLGLTIVRNLVERHGGSVSAHSEGRGAGSEFVVRLPKATVAAMAADRTVAIAAAEAGIVTAILRRRPTRVGGGRQRRRS